MHNDNQPASNPLLRAYATQTAFQVSLTRNMVGGLDAIARGDRNIVCGTHRSNALFVPIMRQLRDRGLVLHYSDPEQTFCPSGRPDDEFPKEDINCYYRLTKAGWLLHDLLAEAGLVTAIPQKSKQRKKVA